MSKSFKKLLNGNEIFKSRYQEKMEKLKSSQSPKVMVVSCCDSRIDPSLMLQCEPGDLFIVRNVANIIPPYEKDDKSHGTSAALEFAIKHLKIKDLVILGHSDCGGMKAFVNGNIGANDFISNWVSLFEGIKTCTCINKAVKTGLQKSYENCFDFPWIKEAVEKGQLEIHRAFFDIESLKLECFSTSENKFVDAQDY